MRASASRLEPLSPPTCAILKCAPENKKIFSESSLADLLYFLPHPLKVILSNVLLSAKFAADRLARVHALGWERLAMLIATGCSFSELFLHILNMFDGSKLKPSDDLMKLTLPPFSIALVEWGTMPSSLSKHHFWCNPSGSILEYLGGFGSS